MQYIYGELYAGESLLQHGSHNGNNCLVSMEIIASISLLVFIFLSYRHTTVVAAHKYSVSAHSTQVFYLSFLQK